MTIGLAFLIILLPLVAVFIGTYFETVSQYLVSALYVLQTVPVVAADMWSVLPSGITQVVIALLVLTLSVNLLRHILGIH